MNESTDGEIVAQYTHSIKYNYTTSGLRPDIHIWSNDRDTAVTEAFETFKATILKLEEAAIKDPDHADLYKLAPFEIREKKIAR